MADDEIILDEIDLTTNDGEDSALNFTPLAEFGQGRENIPGILAGVSLEDGEENAWAEDGILHIPQGRINSVAAADSWGVDNGNIYIGRANGNSAGVISDCDIDTVAAPILENGKIKFPLAQYDGKCPGNVDPEGSCSGSVDTPGAISSAEYADGDSFRIDNGVLKIPKPEEYQFDTEWFEVTDGLVTLKQDALATVVDELAAEMSVEVTGTGVLEETYAGTLKANTSGNLTLDTFVTY